MHFHGNVLNVEREIFTLILSGISLLLLKLLLTITFQFNSLNNNYALRWKVNAFPLSSTSTTAQNCCRENLIWKYFTICHQIRFLLLLILRWKNHENFVEAFFIIKKLFWKPQKHTNFYLLVIPPPKMFREHLVVTFSNPISIKRWDLSHNPLSCV